MVEVKISSRVIDNPYTLRLHGVSEEMFDELTDEDTKAELIDGVMIVHSPASLQHEDLGSFVGGLMGFYAEARGLGKVIASGNGIVRLSGTRKLAPDAFFISQAQLPSPLPKQFPGSPDLVVEILSPSNRHDDLNEKRAAYRAGLVAESWFIDAEYCRVIIDRLRGGVYEEEVVTSGRIRSSVIDGFWLEADWLWSEPLPNKMSCLRQILGD